MILNKDKALKVAEFLLKIKAVELKPNDPFTWASGWKSPIYCDNRKTLSFPDVRTYLRQAYSEIIVDAFGKPDVIAGVATGGIAQGALVAQELGIPFVYVRDKAKGHGLENLIEGVIESGQSVVLVEDLISTGGSSLKAVEALRNAGANVKGLAAIFTYSFDVSIDNFKNASCPFVTLSDYDSLMEQALHMEYINESDLHSLQEWKVAPSKWKK